MKKKSHILFVSMWLIISVLIAVTQTQAASAMEETDFERNFLFFSDNPDENVWWQSRTLIDAAGGVHSTFYTNSTVYYAYCASDCGTLANWAALPLASLGNLSSLAHPTISLDGKGHPRLMWNNDSDYIYAMCDTNCTHRNHWQTVTISIPDYYNLYPRDSRYFEIDPQTGQIQIIAYYYQGFLYGYCDANCLSTTNWHFAAIELDHGGNSLETVQLVLTSTGKPRILGIDDNSNLTYLACDQHCSLTQNWQYVALADDMLNLNYPTFTLRLDDQDRPRVAYYTGYHQDKKLYYAWSNTNSMNRSSWTFDSLKSEALEPASDRTLDMVLDSQGNPHIMFADKNYDLRYVYCIDQCNTVNSIWNLQYVETGEQLDADYPITPGDGYWASAWWIDGYPSLVLDSKGMPFVSYFARNVWYIDTSTSNHAWSIRFAAAGSGSGLPISHHKVFIPLTIK